MMEQKEFIARLVQLRVQKGVSAREMSLSIGQSEGYINSLENGKSFPGMENFFNICEYFGISPSEFFDTGTPCPAHLRALIEDLKRLDAKELEVVHAVVRSMRK